MGVEPHPLAPQAGMITTSYRLWLSVRYCLPQANKLNTNTWSIIFPFYVSPIIYIITGEHQLLNLINYQGWPSQLTFIHLAVSKQEIKFVIVWDFINFPYTKNNFCKESFQFTSFVTRGLFGSFGVSSFRVVYYVLPKRRSRPVSIGRLMGVPESFVSVVLFIQFVLLYS